MRCSTGWQAPHPPCRCSSALDDVRRAVRAEADTGDEALATDEPSLADLATALLGWAPRFADATALREAIDARRALLAALRRDDAVLTLATAHGTKGLEWDHVVVLADGFPGRRSVADATEPERALEEERRLAYVAWTRARRSLTLLFDPAAPSRVPARGVHPRRARAGGGCRVDSGATSHRTREGSVPARRDGTEPMIVHGQVFLRPAEREDLPLFVRWFGDARTTRTLSAAAPMSLASEEDWFERVVANQGRDGYHFAICRLEDDRPVGTIGLFEMDLRNGSAGLGISIGDPADTARAMAPTPFARSSAGPSTCSGSSGSGSTSTPSTPGPASSTSGWASSTKGRRATARSGSASTWTSTGCRSSPASGEPAPGPRA